MTASPSQLQASIEPDSTEYGSRQTLEAGLQNIGGAVPGPAAPVGGLSGAPAPPGANPLDAMLNGRVSPQGLPATDGLSVGPGYTPSTERAPSGTEQRLRLLATEASSPFMRVQAQRALRRYLRQRRRVTGG